MVQNQEAIGAVITAENGKPYGEGKGEVGYSASFCDWASHECRRVHGETMSSPWADSYEVLYHASYLKNHTV